MSQNYEYFGKYILLEKLATGGMAEVWLARATSTGGIGKFVAIKKILPQYSDNPEFMQMFKDEATIAMNLSHSNIVSIYEFGQDRNQLYLVMDYVEGRNLRQILNKMKQTSQTFSTDQIVYAIKEVAAGLDHAHRSLNSATGKPLNITHRDMSPQNVMITFEGEVKIVDFGIAKAESQIENTKTGTLKGKFGYMSPEQAEGHPTDLRTDIFSLGICLWELLANDRLFIANNEINTLKKIRDCNIPSLAKVNPNISVELERITMKALTRDRNLRYQTAAAMHRDLNRFLNRQFPDFTPHDFSVFIKTVYTDEILETRKRLIEYTKIPLKPKSVGKPDESIEITSFAQLGDQVTATKSDDNSLPDSSSTGVSLTNSPKGKPSQFGKTQTETRPPRSFGNDKSISIVKNNINEKVLDETILKKNLNSRIVVSPKTPQDLTETEHLTQISRVGFTKKHTGRIANASGGKSRPKRSNNHTFNLMVFTACLIITYVLGTTFFSQEISNVMKNVFDIGSHSTAAKPIPIMPTEELTSNIEKSKTVDNPLTSGLVINSIPSGAEIIINDISTGKTTPSRIEVPSDQNFSLTLKLPRYLEYTKNDISPNVGRSLTATLQKAMVAYLDLDVRPPRNVIVTVNGVTLKDEMLPLSRYAIPAGTPVTVRAESIVTGAIAEEKVTLKEYQRYRIILRLDQKSRNPSGRN